MYPDGGNNSDREPFGARATSNNSPAPQASNDGNEYWDNSDSKDCGKLLGSLASNSDKRVVELYSERMGTPDVFNLEANESINPSLNLDGLIPRPRPRSGFERVGETDCRARRLLPLPLLRSHNLPAPLPVHENVSPYIVPACVHVLA